MIKYLRIILHTNIASQNDSLFEAPRSMLSNYFGKIQVLRDNFGEIWRVRIQMYPQTSIEPKYGEFYLKNEVSAHGLVLLVQLS